MQFSAFFAAVMALAALFQGAVAAAAEAAVRVRNSTNVTTNDSCHTIFSLAASKRQRPELRQGQPARQSDRRGLRQRRPPLPPLPSLQPLSLVASLLYFCCYYIQIKNFSNWYQKR
jgi:hypothetical protein